MYRLPSMLEIGLSTAVTLSLGACGYHVPPVDLEPGGDPGLQAYRISDVDEAPKLIECAEQSGPPASTISGGRWEYVTVGFIVTESGQVDNNSIYIRSVARRPRHPDASPKSIAEAQLIALSCRYEPGTIAGQPVRVAVDRTFRILAIL